MTPDLAPSALAILALVFLLALVLLLLGMGLWRAVDAHRGPDWGGPWLNRLDGLNRLLCRRYHRLPEIWLPLPDRGPVLLASNHVSGLDPLLLVAASRRPLRFLIAREQYERWGLQWLFRAAGCIPVDRGARPEQALRAALRALQAGEAVALFPHGRIHLPSDPPRPLKPGVAWLAAQVHCPVVPARVEGIRAEGHVILAPFLRSQARIHTFPSIACAELGTPECLAQLKAVIG